MSFWADIAANVIAVAHLAYFVFIVGGMVAMVFAVRRDGSLVVHLSKAARRLSRGRGDFHIEVPDVVRA